MHRLVFVWIYFRKLQKSMPFLQVRNNCLPNWLFSKKFYIFANPVFPGFLQGLIFANEGQFAKEVQAKINPSENKSTQKLIHLK